MTRLRSIAIAGGGVDAWLSAACLLRALDGQGYAITVVEVAGCDEPAGAAEAGLAPLRAFHALLSLPESMVLEAADGARCMGSRMEGFGLAGDFILPYGEAGTRINGVAFHHYIGWLTAQGRAASLDDYNLAVQIARSGRFQPPSQAIGSVRATYTYGLNLDLAGYARLLKSLCLHKGVRRVDARAISVTESGLACDGQAVAADLILDATGPRRLVSQGFRPAGPPLQCRWETEAQRPSLLNTVTRRAGGYRMTLPLGRRTATAVIGEAVEGPSLTLQPGCLDAAWQGRIIAVGQAAGVSEPLGASRLHWLQAGLTRLLALFPDRNLYPSLAAEYNRLMRDTWDRQRDAGLAFRAVDAPDGDWPESLKRRLIQFRSRGHVVQYDEDVFSEQDWVNLFFGLGWRPERFDPLVLSQDEAMVRRTLDGMRAAVQKAVSEAAA
ncbi:tryptophan 7-halogenase [Asticcacaulis solisilvae]|uniref:tryptophan 7-halogenase n=1 Tax=Asticcacaulis solisilvae TaxID=1217274 RepID=UPI003FD742B8